MDGSLVDKGPGKAQYPLVKEGRCRNCTKREGTLCDVLTCDELDRLDGFMMTATFDPGQTIFFEGDKLANYYNITKGVIRLIKLLPDGRRAILDFLYRGDFLGLNAKGQYAYSAEAITPVRLCRFPRPQWQAMFADKPKMEGRLLGIYTDKLVANQQRLTDLARKSPRERLATFLLDLAKKEGLRYGDGGILLPMSREDISDFLGLTIETISRTFSAFSKEGLLEIQQRKKVNILEAEKLEAIAESL